MSNPEFLFPIDNLISYALISIFYLVIDCIIPFMVYFKNKTTIILKFYKLKIRDSRHRFATFQNSRLLQKSSLCNKIPYRRARALGLAARAKESCIQHLAATICPFIPNFWPNGHEH